MIFSSIVLFFSTLDFTFFNANRHASKADTLFGRLIVCASQLDLGSSERAVAGEYSVGKGTIIHQDQ